LKACVTGGAGFIGSHLAHALVAAGHEVRVLDDLSTGKADNLRAVLNRIELHQGDIRAEEDVRRALAGCERVYHLAALPSVALSVQEPLRCHDICATGTLRVLDVARRLGVRRVVYAASSSAYGDQPGDVRREDDALLPLSPYAAAKLAGEHYCQAATAVYGIETVRLRFFNIFGPRQDAASPYSGVIALFIAAMLQGKTPTIYGDGLQARDFVYVDNAVHALMLAGEAPAAVGKVYNIGAGGSVSVLDLVRHLNELLGTAVVPQHQPARPGDVRFSQADITRARHDLGFEPRVAFRDGLAQTVAWRRSVG
jgi:UDP-glucose 4-epimerase